MLLKSDLRPLHDAHAIKALTLAQKDDGAAALGSDDWRASAGAGAAVWSYGRGVHVRSQLAECIAHPPPIILPGHSRDGRRRGDDSII